MLRGSLILSVLIGAFFISNLVSASGTRDFEAGQGTPRKGSAASLADITYEHGKSIFKGRNQRYGKINLCVPAGDKLKKAKKKSLKPYVGGSIQLLADNLHNCDQPTQKIQTVLNDTDMTALLFYLNRRHKLKLTR